MPAKHLLPESKLWWLLYLLSYCQITIEVNEYMEGGRNPGLIGLFLCAILLGACV